MSRQKYSEQPKVIECTCENEYQNKKYGKWMRLMNPTKKESNSKQLFRCTVCGREHTK